jgi:hypothetical protein
MFEIIINGNKNQLATSEAYAKFVKDTQTTDEKLRVFVFLILA